MKCPICNEELEEISFTEDIWGCITTVEEHRTCKKCNLYEYEYCYGYSTEWIGNKMFCDKKYHKYYIKFIRLIYKIRKIFKVGD